MEVMALAALAAQSHEETTTTSPAVRSPATVKAEPEGEPTLPSSSPSCSPSSAMKSEEEDKMAIVSNNDVEMECDEEAADAHELDDESNQEEEEEEEEEEPHPRDYKTDRHGRLNQDRLRSLDPAPVREYPEELASAAATSSSSSSSPWALSSSSPQWPSSSKRKRLDADSSSAYSSNRIMIDGIDMGKPLPSSTKRKGSSDFLRKGQWTPTEERLARLLIEAFEEGYLPIFTGIRLRGYLAVQLQCDPMRISKKLCAGTIDGKKIPKNYGQKKFRLRKKLLWDREQAGRILATLERLTRELWAETGIPLPSYLTLSSTRSLCPEEELLLTGCVSEGRSSKSSPVPVKKLSPPANKSKKQKNGVVFPIIYLNLSKKTKQQGKSSYDTAVRQYGFESPYAESEDGSVQAVGYPSRRVRGHNSNNSDSETTSSSDEGSGVPQPVRVDGESLQAAYDLLNLQRRSTSPVSSSRSSTPCPSSPAAKRARREVEEEEEEEEELSPVRRRFVSTPPSSASSQASGSVPIRPAPTKPTILRQQAPTVSS